MERTFEAVYENGVLRPLETLAISNMQRVLVTISDVPATAAEVAGYFEPEEWETAKHDDVSLDEVRLALAAIPGSLADAVIASREER
jgi:predicted DNA-binding antitoxin AbrB/MazE fold protein